jgi:hypothetical protein
MDSTEPVVDEPQAVEQWNSTEITIDEQTEQQWTTEEEQQQPYIEDVAEQQQQQELLESADDTNQYEGYNETEGEQPYYEE